jgi:hypothetical protein
MGMNYPGIDNRQLALNIMHWLAGVKFPAPADLLAAKPKATVPSNRAAVASSSPIAFQPADTPLSPATPTTEVATTRRPAEPGRILSLAEIAEESEPSIAMITGDGSVGTGFLVRPGVIATNAHVIDGEFITNLRVRFPSASKAKQGPIRTLTIDETPSDLDQALRQRAPRGGLAEVLTRNLVDFGRVPNSTVGPPHDNLSPKFGAQRERRVRHDQMVL